MDATFPCRKIVANIGSMPELPEVEVICRGLTPLLAGRTVKSVRLLRKELRYPLPETMVDTLVGRRFEAVVRRAKYLQFLFDDDPVLLWHLGMTGQFHVVDATMPLVRHEHVRIALDNGAVLSYRDARRFGYAGLTTRRELDDHPWFARLGPEPLGGDFNGVYLVERCRGRKSSIKSTLMSADVVVGVGNIYASESLFRSGIHPARAAGRISAARLALLAGCVKQVLAEAIEAGGSSISDFVKADGKPGYFAHSFRVYGREGEACAVCAGPIRRIVQSGRSSFFCPGCQR